MTGLVDDMTQMLAPLRQLAERLSVAEKYLVERVCDDVIGMCEDEERNTEVTVQLLMDADEREEDR